MTPAIVQKLLTETPQAVKEIHLSDGSHVCVTKREQWIAAPDALVVLVLDGALHHITYWNITSIRHLPRNGRKARKKAR